MLAILFTNLLMLAGLSALAAPVIIHLLLRQRKKRQRFSTLQFFAKLEEQSSQRRKLRNWLLLSLRLLLFALLVLAFARPYFPEPANASAQKRRDVILVLDRSLSMQATDADGLRWMRAMDAARKVLGELKDNDRAAVVTCGANAEVVSTFTSPTAVTARLKDLPPAFTTADIGAGLERAVKLLELADAGAASTIDVISDLQRASCVALDSHPVPQRVEVKVLHIGDVSCPNLAVTELKLEGRVTARLRVGLANFADENSSAKLAVVLDGKEVSASNVNLNIAQTTNLDVTLPSLKSGWHTVEVRLGAKDALSADNVRYQTVFVPQPIRVLLVETRQTRRTFEEETFFVAAALNPLLGGTNSVETGFVFEKSDVAGLASKLAAVRRAWDVVMLPGLKELPIGTGDLLQKFVSTGGGVALFLGEGISANRYNSELRELLPARLNEMEADTGSSLPWRIGRYRTNAELFAIFSAPNSGNLDLAEFTRRFMLTPREESLVAASFDDGVPLVIGGESGRGKIVLVNTSMDTAWTDWPKHKTFVPWMHSLARYLAGVSGDDPLQPAASFIAGIENELSLGSSARHQALTLRAPDGKEIAVTADDSGVIHTERSTPGVYSLRDSAGAELKRFAVNVSAAESDLAALLPPEFQQQLVRTDESPKRTLAATVFGSTDSQKEVWRYLLLGAVALLFIESFVANRTFA